jgi:hypothetical protein
LNPLPPPRGRSDLIDRPGSLVSAVLAGQGRSCGPVAIRRSRNSGSSCRIVVARLSVGDPRRCRRRVWAGSNLRVVPAPTSSAASYPYALMRSMSAGRLARSPGVAGHGLVQSAEGLLDAGIDLVRTLGAALACSLWLGRELGEPCSGLVGDWAGLVALGAVEAIIRVGLRGVGHGDHPGSRSGWAAKPAPRSEGNFQASAWARCTLRLLADRVNPASDVTSRWISPGIYGERGSAVAAGRLVSEADGD